MASAMLLGGCWLLLQVSWIVAQENCPTVDSIFPPSGTVRLTYLVRGNNLYNLSRIRVDVPGTPVEIQVAETMHNGTHLRFTIGGRLLSEGLQNVMFFATIADCQTQLRPLQLDLRTGK